jgi:putative transcriptional regulator
MTDALADKRTATRVRILVEIAERQPAVSQGEIADAVGITSQAVSEYIRALISEGHVRKEARSRYTITTEGVDWLYQEVRALRSFTERITDEVLGSVSEDTAVATASVEPGTVVTLSMEGGMLHATPGDTGPATAVATTAAAAGDPLGVSQFSGVIAIDEAGITLGEVPTVREATDPDLQALAELAASVDIVVAEGIEAVAACAEAAVSVETSYAVGAVAAAAAAVGESVLIVGTTDTIGRIGETVRDSEIEVTHRTLGQ